jgi:crotonobetainyl-CoA:carnitine CoA-transferase CaiB-like acyl-CoA transferase
MCRALNRQDLIDDPRFRTARDRSINAVERREIISNELEKWTAGEILPRLLANDVPSAPALSRFELLQERQVLEYATKVAAHRVRNRYIRRTTEGCRRLRPSAHWCPREPV